MVVPRPRVAAIAAARSRDTRVRDVGPAGAGPPTPPATDAFHDAWSTALGDLELDVQTCERLLATLHEADLPEVVAALGSWTPPTSLGPLPGSLADRARIILARQLQVSEQLAEAAVRSQQHLELQRRMRPDDAVIRPMFVDAAF